MRFSRPAGRCSAAAGVAAGSTLLVLILVAPGVAVATTTRKPAAVEAAAPRSATELRRDVGVLASGALQGRDNDTSGSRAAQRWLVRRLEAVGQGLFRDSRGEHQVRQPWSLAGQRGVNLVVTIPGRERSDEVVLVGAHYDHLDSRSDRAGHCRAGGAPGGSVCNGATDNASGSAVVLEIGRALRRLDVRPRRTVVLALWDGEEDGLLGSRAWVESPPIPLARTVAYVNFDIQGAEILPALVPITFALGAETGGALLEGVVAAAIAPETGLQVQPLSLVFGQGRSDHAVLHSAGIPVVFFSDSTGPCYHTTGDDVSGVNFAKLTAQARVGFRTVLALADAEATPTLVTPPAPIVHADAVRLAKVVRRGLQDLALFPAQQHARLLEIGLRFEQIAATPADQFGPADLVEVGSGTLEMIDAITGLECRGRWPRADRAGLLDLD